MNGWLGRDGMVWEFGQIIDRGREGWLLVERGEAEG